MTKSCAIIAINKFVQDWQRHLYQQQKNIEVIQVILSAKTDIRERKHNCWFERQSRKKNLFGKIDRMKEEQRIITLFMLRMNWTDFFLLVFVCSLIFCAGVIVYQYTVCLLRM